MEYERYIGSMSSEINTTDDENTRAALYNIDVSLRVIANAIKSDADDFNVATALRGICLNLQDINNTKKGTKQNG